MLPPGGRRLLSLGDHPPRVVEALVSLGHVVGDVGPRAFRIRVSKMLERPHGGGPTAGERLEPRHAARQQVVDLRLGGDDALENRERLGRMPLRMLHVRNRPVGLAGIEQVGGKCDMLASLAHVHRRIGARLGEQPAFRALGFDLLLGVVGRCSRLVTAIVGGLEGIEPVGERGEPGERSLEPAAGVDRIALEIVPRKRQAAARRRSGCLKRCARPAARGQLLDAARGLGHARLELRGQVP